MKTVDIHAHWYPREWVNLFEKEGPKDGGTLERLPGGGYQIRTKLVLNRFDDSYIELNRILGVMDKRRVDLHALSLTAPMVYWASPGPGLALAQAFNDAASAAHQKHPDRFVGLAQAPMQTPAVAVREIERAAKLPGMKGFYLSTNVNGENLDEKRFWDVYAKCEELGWPIFLHPVETIGLERTPRYHLKNLLGNPYDTGVAAASLIFGGVLDEFPRLEVNLPHAGGALPGLIGRLDHGTKVRPELKHMKRLPSEYLRRFSYDTIGHSDRINSQLVQLVGADRVLLGSDYCFDMGLEDPIGTVNRIENITPSQKEMICGGNAAKLLRL